MGEGFEVVLGVAADHPALRGHFPGAPVVPGVVILGQLLAETERRLGRPLSVSGISQAKFLAPLLPGEEARAVLQMDRERLTFRVERAGRVIAQGIFLLRGEVA